MNNELDEKDNQQKKRTSSNISLDRRTSTAFYNSTVLEKSRQMISSLRHVIKHRKSVKLQVDSSRLTQISRNTSIIDMLHNSLDQWNTFDIFEFATISDSRPLSQLANYLFHKLNFFQSFNIDEDRFIRFIVEIEDGYNVIPYHNQIHAADVLYNLYYFITSESLRKLVTPLDVLAAIVAAGIHDYKHPGTNNNFQINAQTQLSTLYNDQSILENMHVAEAYKILRKSETNIFKNLTLLQQKQMRETIIHMVLATDMKNSGKHMERLSTTIQKKKLNNTWFDVNDKEDRLIILETAIHMSDIANPCKNWKICKEWTRRIMKELFNQGDKEKSLSLPISYLCDRDDTPLKQSQIGFIQYVVQPLLLNFIQICPEAAICLENLKANLDHWQNISIKEANEIMK